MARIRTTVICTVCGEPLDEAIDDVVCTRCDPYVGDDDPEISVARLHPYWRSYYLSLRRPPERLRSYSDGENPGWYVWYWARGRDPLAEYIKRRIPQRLRAAVIARDGYVCQLCGLAVARTDVHIDHRVPEFAGGKATLENLQVAHSSCNISKGSRLPAVMYA